MKLGMYQFTANLGWSAPLDVSLDSGDTVIFIFGASQAKHLLSAIDELKKRFPKSNSIGCSTAGEIYKDEIFDDSLSIAIVRFEKTRIQNISLSINKSEESLQVGKMLSDQLDHKDLKSVFVLSEGLNVNGSDLVEGLRDNLPKGVVISGGLAGDRDRFERTWVLSDFKIQQNLISAVAFYGGDVCISHGSKGGWDVMGIDRKVTKSSNNVLYELDDRPALALYKEYLGERAVDLPASGLLFPLAIQNSDSQDEETVRTILGVNEKENSITFAGNIPQGSTVRLMHANFDRLIDGASSAAELINVEPNCQKPLLAIAISCVGRRLVLGQRSDEEVEATLDVLPKGTEQIGFYSYGEISPLTSGQCDLHNQTMTLTLLGEK